jgi:hypothetical protein
VDTEGGKEVDVKAGAWEGLFPKPLNTFPFHLAKPFQGYADNVRDSGRTVKPPTNVAALLASHHGQIAEIGRTAARAIGAEISAGGVVLAPSSTPYRATYLGRLCQPSSHLYFLAISVRKSVPHTLGSFGRTLYTDHVDPSYL